MRREENFRGPLDEKCATFEIGAQGLKKLPVKVTLEGSTRWVAHEFVPGSIVLNFIKLNFLISLPTLS